MGLLDSLTKAFTSPSANNRPTDGSKGAYWCDDCNVRIRDVETDRSGEDELPCPECGTEMRFEYSSGRGCAC